MVDINQAVSSKNLTIEEMPPPKAVRTLQTSHDIVSTLGSKLTSLEKRLEHVSLPDNLAEIRKDSQVPTEPNSNFVSGLLELNHNLQDISNRISNILELLEI